MSARLSVLISAACLAAVVFAIVGTYSRLSQTVDEPTHIATGLEWLQDGRFTYRTENPPLPRVIVALWPYLSGVRLPPPPQRRHGFIPGSKFLYQGSGYISTLSRARAGTLVFLVISAAAAWLWAGGAHQPSAAALAVGMFVTLPAVVAHAGLATTDIAFVATALLAGLALTRLLERSTWSRTVGLGAVLGLSVATKFSAFVFLPPIAAAISVTWLVTGWHPARISSTSVLRLVCQAGTLTLVAFLVIWASYRFSVGRLSDLPSRFGQYGRFPETGMRLG